MNIVKPDEALQAQVASYAAERLTGREYIEIARLLGHSTLAQAMPEIDTRDDYRAYVREVEQGASSTIEARTELLKAFTEFEAPVESIFQDFESLKTRKDHPSYLGSGLLSDAFMLTHNNKEYVIKIPRSYDENTGALSGLSPNPEAINDMVTPALRAKGISHLEQVTAASYDKGVLVVKRMPGKPITELTDKEREMITDEQLATLAETFQRAEKAGVVPELENPDNLFYDPSVGFGLIDYDSVDSQIFKTLCEYVPLGLEFNISCVSRALNFMNADPDVSTSLAHRVRNAFEATQAQ